MKSKLGQYRRRVGVVLTVHLAITGLVISWNHHLFGLVDWVVGGLLWIAVPAMLVLCSWQGRTWPIWVLGGLFGLRAIAEFGLAATHGITLAPLAGERFMWFWMVGLPLLVGTVYVALTSVLVWQARSAGPGRQPVDPNT
jgi:hypothetical protein